MTLVLDGSRGEGGGQILRTALALSALGNRSMEIRNIRARRSKPGLARQHLACVLAAAKIVDAQVEGAELRSKRLRFAPTRQPQAGDYEFDIGTAGSTALVFQTVLWPLLAADGRSTIVIRGGTHNPMAPTFEFLERSFLPLVRRFGAVVGLSLERHGFYPRGGGVIRASIEGPISFESVTLLERGKAEPVNAEVIAARGSADDAGRGADQLASNLDISRDRVSIALSDASGQGCAMIVSLGFEYVVETVSAIAERGGSPERVANEAAIEAQTYLASEAPLGQHFADQLVIPLALAGEGELRCTTPSLHTRTNIGVVRDLLDVEITLEKEQSHSGCYRMGLR